MWLFCTKCGANYDAEDPTHMAWHAWLDATIGPYPPPPIDPEPDPDPEPQPEPEPEPTPTPEEP